MKQIVNFIFIQSKILYVFLFFGILYILYIHEKKRKEN